MPSALLATESSRRSSTARATWWRREPCWRRLHEPLTGAIIQQMEPWEEHDIQRPHLPSRVSVYEVGPRDGLQNEPETLPVDVRIALVDRLTDAGLPAIE